MFAAFEEQESVEQQLMLSEVSEDNIRTGVSNLQQYRKSLVCPNGIEVVESLGSLDSDTKLEY